MNKQMIAAELLKVAKALTSKNGMQSRSATAATHSQLYPLETSLINAKEDSEKLKKLLLEETKSNDGKCLRENSDFWGTIGVNALVLGKRCEELQKLVDKARKG